MVNILPTSVLNNLPYQTSDPSNLDDWSISFGSPQDSKNNEVDFVASHHANDDQLNFANSQTAKIMENRGYDAVALQRMNAAIPISEDAAAEVGETEPGNPNRQTFFDESKLGDFDANKPDLNNRYRVFYEAAKIVHDYHNSLNEYDANFKPSPNSIGQHAQNMQRDNARKRTPAEVSQFGLQFGGQLNYNDIAIVSAALKKYPPEVAISIAHILQEYDRLPNWTWDGSKRMLEGLLSSPSTYVGAGSIKAVSGLLNLSSKSAVQKSLTKRLLNLAGGSSIIGVEGGTYTAMHDIIHQKLKAGGRPYKHNMKQTLQMFGIGFGAGGLLTAALPLSVAGVKSASETYRAAGLARTMTQPGVLRSGIGPVPPAETAATDVSEIGFFSSVSRAIDNLPMDKGSSAQMRAMIAKSEGVKPEEMSWTGLDEFLKGRKNVTKAEIREFMDANQVRIKQVEKTSYGQTGEPENLTWGEAVADDSFEAYGHRVDDIEYELERGDDFFLEDIIRQLMKDNPKKYTEIDPDGGSAWANKLRKHFEEGGTVSDLDDKMRYDVNNAIDGVAKAEYMDNPYVTVRDGTGHYDIYGNDDVGYQITRRSDGARVNDTEIYSLEEAKIQAYTDGLDYGYIGGQLDEGDTLFSEYTLPGGENYREVLLTTGPRLENYPTREAYNEAIRAQDARGGPFQQGHFDEANVLAHVRLNDRTGPNGEKILFVEEVQSDWHQKGRKEGYKTPGPQFTEPFQVTEQTEGLAAPSNYILYEVRDANGEFITNVGSEAAENADQAVVVAQGRIRDKKLVRDVRVPDAPLKKNWHEMAMRRVIRMASEEGYDSIAWTPGQLQADRYDLSKHIDALRVEKIRDGEKAGQFLVAGRKGASTHSSFQKAVTEEELPNVIGKDLAAKVVKDAPKYPDGTEYTGLDLKVGGEGMKGFYDKIIKNYAEKFGKKFGAKVGVTKIGDGDEVWNLRITKKMRDSVMKKGVPLFGAGAIAAGTDKDNNQPAL
tara:strand:- start:6043 stop:9027 length:2985 start_codon:yes stop_codon:yes gene_type:complete